MSQMNEAEVALTNEAKALAEQCGAFVEKLRAHGPQDTRGHDIYIAPLEPPVDQRWVSIGATDLQRGFMALLRAIAQPTTF